MSTALLASLDQFALWRHGLAQAVDRLVERLADAELLDAGALAQAGALRQRLASERLVLAFVAEFSRGKSELINALFFADTGRRVLPAAPGRTTMCPVELAWDPQQPPSLALLPIASRGSDQTLAALRAQPAQWRRLPLPVDDPQALAQVLQQLVRTAPVAVDVARALGFWDDAQPEDNPPCDAQGRVELPVWRHALVNYPHPLLQRGLVVLDTPGLNAIGAEPELTLALLPSAHAAVFVLGADSGVTRSDLAVWTEHLADPGLERFVVLNKIDTLDDPLLDPEQVEDQVQRQCALAAATLGVAPAQVFPLSARQALAARVRGDAAALASSRLPALEAALLHRLLPQRSQVIARLVDAGLQALHQSALRRLGERQRCSGEQLAELRGLRGDCAGRLQQLDDRAAAAALEIERCGPRLAALRAVLGRQLQALLDGLSDAQVQALVQRLHDERNASLLKLGTAPAFARLVQRLQALLDQAGARADEIAQMLEASRAGLQAEFGIALDCGPRPTLARQATALARIAQRHGRHLGLGQAWRLAQPGALARFSRLLTSRLQQLFDDAAGEFAQWAGAADAQLDAPLQARRQGLLQRRDALQRIRAAEDGLAASLAERSADDAALQTLTERIATDVECLRRLAAAAPAAASDAAAADPAAGVARQPAAAPALQLVAAAPPRPAPQPAARAARGAA